MSGRATSHAIKSNLEYVFRNKPYDLDIPTWFLGLSTVKTKDRYNSPVEPKDPAYNRVAISRDSENWEVDEDKGVVYNAKEVRFNMATEHWGTIYEVFIIDGLYNKITKTDGEIWFTHTFEKQVHVIDGSVLIFPAKSLKFSRLEE